MRDGVEKVKNLIAALPEEDVVKLTDKGAVTAAKTAYDNLTADQKKLVGDITKLNEAEAKIAELDLEGMSVGVVLGKTVETTKGVKAAEKQDKVPEVAEVKQVVELKVTDKASADGSIKIDNEDVAVLETDVDAAAIATKIAAHNFTNWNVEVKSGQTDTVVFTAKLGAKDVNIATDMKLTGVTVEAPKTTINGVEFKAGTDEVPAVVEAKEVGTTTVTAGAKKNATIKVKVADGTLNKTVDVEVKDGDTAEIVAQKIRTKLGTDDEVVAAYDVNGADANIVLTQKSAGTDVDLAVTLV